MANNDMSSNTDDTRHGEFIVDWQGQHDPEIPRNWPSVRKWTNVLLISMLTVISPFGSSMLAPSMDEVVADFGPASADVQSITISIYVLGYAFGPLIYAPLSELFGRRIPLVVSSALFTLVSVACALSVDFAMLVVFRFLTGLVGSSTLALGPASISDMFEPEHCGKAMAVWNLPVLLGPALGPLVGSYLTAAGGWRWNSWFLAIVMGVLFIASSVLLRESHAMTVLENKARAMRKMQNNEKSIVSALNPKTSPSDALRAALVRPTKLLVFSPIVLVLSLCSAVSYGFIYLLFTSMTPAFMRRYGMKNPEVGLTYLGFGIGNITGNLLLGIFADKMMRAMARKSGEMKPEYRLPLLIPGSLLMPAGLLIFGWTLEFTTHWIVPELGLFIFGLGTIFISMPVNTYLINAFPKYAASATAANTVLRSVLGGLLPLCGGKIYDSVGDGWGNSILAFIGVAFIPAVLFIYRYGERLRTKGISL